MTPVAPAASDQRVDTARDGTIVYDETDRRPADVTWYGRDGRSIFACEVANSPNLQIGAPRLVFERPVDATFVPAQLVRHE